MAEAHAPSADRGVAVVGGGWGGLAAARRLARAGVPVTVFERGGRLGGLAMTFPFADTAIEKYYHHWFTSDRDAVDLVRELGLGDRLRWISPVMGMFSRGRVWRFTSPADLLRFEPLGWPAKVRFAAVTLFLQRYPRREAFEDRTAASWLRRHAGREVYEVVWGPLLRAKFGRNAERVSMAWIWSKMRLRGTSRQGASRESLGYLDGGFGLVADRLAEEIERHGGRVLRAEPVRRVSAVGAAGNGRFEVETTKRREHFARVVSTVAPPLLARLAPDLPAGYRRRLEAVEHAAILCTLLVLREPVSPIYWMNVGDPAVPFGGLIEHTNFVEPERYGGRRLAYLSHYVYRDEPIWGFDSDRLFEHYRPGLERIRAGLASVVSERMTFRDDWAQPIVTADYHRRLLALETPWPGLFTASMAQIYPEDRGTNYAVRQGRHVAEAVLASLAPLREPAGVRPPLR